MRNEKTPNQQFRLFSFKGNLIFITEPQTEMCINEIDWLISEPEPTSKLNQKFAWTYCSNLFQLQLTEAELEPGTGNPWMNSNYPCDLFIFNACRVYKW